jgi:hypothetical protein
MLNITRRDLDEAYTSMRDAHSYIQRYRQGGERVTGQLVQTLEVGAGALAVGVASGRFGALNIAGSPIPLDLAGGILGHALGFFGLAGKYGEHLHNFSDGVLAGYLTKWGIGFGTELRRKAGQPPVMTVAGTEDIIGYAPAAQMGCGAEPLTEAELASLAHSVR